jgi:hypothetical protein
MRLARDVTLLIFCYVLRGDCRGGARPKCQTSTVKGGVKLDHWGGGKLDQMSVREMGICKEGGVWSGGLRSGLRTAFRPERKTPPSARDVVVI